MIVFTRNFRGILTPTRVKPDGWDPRGFPTRWCPIHVREIHTIDCAKICGVKYLSECKFSTRDPRPEEMMVALPTAVIEGEDVAWVQKFRKEHMESLRKGGS